MESQRTETGGAVIVSPAAAVGERIFASDDQPPGPADRPADSTTRWASVWRLPWTERNRRHSRRCRERRVGVDVGNRVCFSTAIPELANSAKRLDLLPRNFVKDQGQFFE